MSDTSYLQWPFFDARHGDLARALDAWASEHIAHGHGSYVDAECRSLVKSLGVAGWLKYAVGGRDVGGAADVIDTPPSA